MPKRIFIKDGGLTSSVPTPAGYTVIGSDNGTPKKQVLSTISDIARPYRVYTALLTQTGMDAPVATVLENTLGTINITYSSPGTYYVASDFLFTLNKTAIFTGSTNNGDIMIATQNNNSLLVLTSIGLNDCLVNTPIEIRVYN